MIIKEAYANFGKLNNSKISFNSRFNIVCLPNEGGKSTWCAFLLTMLYGFDPKDRDRTASKDNPLGYISVKNRYAPWNGTPISGKLIVEYEGKEIEIRRWCGKNGILNNFSATYTEDGQPVPFLTSENCGEILCGVSKDAYERSGFIKSGSIVAVGTCLNLDEKINSIISSGNEEISAEKIADNLKKVKNKIRSNATNGALPKALSVLDELNEKISAAKSKAAAQFELHSELLKIQNELKLTEKKIGILDNKENIERVNKLEKAKREYGEAAGELKKAREALLLNGKTVTQEFLAAATEQINAVLSADAAVKAAKKKLDDITVIAEQKQTDVQEKSENDETTQSKQTEKISDKRKEIKKAKRKAALMFLPPIAIYVLSVVSLFSHPWQTSFALALIAAAAAVTAYIQSKPLYRQDENYAAELDKISAESNNSQNGEEENADLPDEDSSQVMNHDLESAQESFKQAAYKLGEMFGAYGVHLKNLEQARRFIKAGLEKLSRLEATKARCLSAKAAFEALSSVQPDVRITVADVEMPKESYSQLTEMRQTLETRAADINAKIAKIDGELSSIGDYGKMLAEKAEIENNIKGFNLKFEAATLALNILSQTNNEFKAQISPKLAEISSKLFAVLTNNRYTNVVIQDGLRAMCSENEASALKSALNVSDGTADQLYLALRLALCELVLRRGNNNAPIIMDDALVNFDEKRANAALNLLYKLSVNRQIIFFTCQNFQ